MAFFILLIYLFLTFIRPFELFPGLTSLHLIQVFGYLGLILTLTYLPITGLRVLGARLLHLTVLFFVITIASVVITQRWIGGVVSMFDELSPTIFLFLFVGINLSSVKRAGILIGTIVALSMGLVFLCHLAIRYGSFADLLVMHQNDAQGDPIARVRGLGFMADPNDLAQTLVMAIALTGAAWRQGRLARNLVLVILPALFLVYGVYLTRSRGAVVSLLVVILIASRRRLGRVLAPLSTTAAAVVLMALNFSGGRGFGAADDSIRNRLEAWSAGLQVLKTHPLIGVGYRYFLDYYHRTEGGAITAHNSFVIAFSELGIFGYLVWIAMLLAARQELAAIQNAPVKTEADLTLQRYARSVQLGLYALLVSGWFLSRTFVPTLYVIIGIALALQKIAQSNGIQLQSITNGALARRSCVFGTIAIILIYLTVKFQIR